MAKPAAAGGAAAPDKKGKKKTFKKKERKHVPHGLCYVQASFKNTIVTITDMNGNVLSWKSSGSLGFRGSAGCVERREYGAGSRRTERGCTRQRSGLGSRVSRSCAGRLGH